MYETDISVRRERNNQLFRNVCVLLALFCAAVYVVFLYWEFDINRFKFVELSWEVFKADVKEVQISDREALGEYLPVLFASIATVALLFKFINPFRMKEKELQRVLFFEKLSALVEGVAFGIALMAFESRYPRAISRLGALLFITCVLVAVALQLLKVKSAVVLIAAYIVVIGWVILTGFYNEGASSFFPTLYLTILVVFNAFETIQALKGWIDSQGLLSKEVPPEVTQAIMDCINARKRGEEPNPKAIEMLEKWLGEELEDEEELCIGLKIARSLLEDPECPEVQVCPIDLGLYSAASLRFWGLFFLAVMVVLI